MKSGRIKQIVAVLLTFLMLTATAPVVSFAGDNTVTKRESTNTYEKQQAMNLLLLALNEKSSKYGCGGLTSQTQFRMLVSALNQSRNPVVAATGKIGVG